MTPEPSPLVTPESLLPLKSIETLMLTMLADGARHGYGIRQDILDHTNGSIEVEVGTLYRHLRRLEADGLITAAGDDERRIFYKLTTLGRRVLAAELLRLRELVRLGEARRIIAAERA